MSEYQYYEFQAIDLALTPKQIAYLRRYSTRATITATSFVNHYEWGSFKGDEDAWMDRFFDAFLHTANWGTNILKLRVPSKRLSPATVRAFSAGDAVAVRQKRGHTIITLMSHDEVDDWDGDHPSLGSMIAIREALARGDLRALYLGWLCSVQNDEIDERTVEPPVPAGLAELDASLHALVEFLRVDADLVRAAARASPPLASPPPRKAVATWIKSLPAADKDAILVRVLADDPTVAVELRERFAVDHRGEHRDTKTRTGRRTVGELVARKRRA